MGENLEGGNRKLHAGLKEHGDRHATIEDRLKSLEKNMGDTLQNHAKTLDALDASHTKMHSGLDELHGRVKGMNDAHGKRHATMEERVTYLEKEMGDSADKHNRAIEALEAGHKKLNGGLDDLHGHVTSHGQRHATIEERMNYLEKEVGDSCDKHARALAALEGDHKKLNGALADRHATLEERLKYIEHQLNDSADKHNQHLRQLGLMDSNHAELKGHLDSVKQQQEKLAE